MANNSDSTCAPFRPWVAASKKPNMQFTTIRAIGALFLGLCAIACQAPYANEDPIAPGEAFAEVTLLFDS